MYNIYNIHNHTMGKATRRVKRMKRSKKQVHRARGRKTNRRRYTRRQRGGREIEVCKKKGLIEAFASGIDITYDDETHLFKIGTKPTIPDLETFNGAQRYTRALFVLKQIGQIETQLDWHNCALFALIYCHTYTHPQCSQIRDFLENYSTSTVIDKNGAVEGSTIGTSINFGKTQFNSGPYKRNIEERFHAAPAPAAAPVAEVPKMSPNVLTVTSDGMIAYNNNHGVMRSVTADKSKTNYEFDNFIIPIRADQPDHIISGKLKVQFVPGKTVVTRFKLELSMSSITPKLIECVKGIDDLVVNIESVSNSFSTIVITGTLTEEKDSFKQKSTYDFNEFVMKFAKCHKECVDAKLEKQIARLSVAEPAKPTIKSIQSTLNTTVEHIDILTRNIDHKQTNVKEYPDPGNALNKIRAQAGVLQMSCNDLNRTLMQLQQVEQVEQSQLDNINAQAYKLLSDVNELLDKCGDIKQRITFPSS